VNAARAIPAGTVWEYRLGRLRFYQGQFFRRSIDVWPAPVTGDKLAEIDGITVSFDPQLRRRIEVLEGKTSAGRRGEIDRVIWMRGISTLVGAHDVVIAKIKVDARTRNLARRLRVGVLDEQAVAAAEAAIGVGPADWVGMHDPEFGEAVVKPLREGLGKAADVNRAGKFLWGSYWFNDEFTRLKQLRTLFRFCQEQVGRLDDALIKLAVGEATVLFALTAYSITAWHNHYSSEDFHRFVEQELNSGVTDVENLRRVLRRVDDLHRHDVEAVHRSYIDSGVARLVIPIRQLENEILRPPEWIEGFLDLTARLRARPQVASSVLRALDLRLARRLGSTRDSAKAEATWANDSEPVHHIADTIERFLISTWLAPGTAYGDERRPAPKPVQAPVQTKSKAELAEAAPQSGAEHSVGVRQPEQPSLLPTNDEPERHPD